MVPDFLAGADQKTIATTNWKCYWPAQADRTIQKFKKFYGQRRYEREFKKCMSGEKLNTGEKLPFSSIWLPNPWFRCWIVLKIPKFPKIREEQMISRSEKQTSEKLKFVDGNTRHNL
jgi:hypothetical protein